MDIIIYYANTLFGIVRGCYIRHMFAGGSFCSVGQNRGSRATVFVQKHSLSGSSICFLKKEPQEVLFEITIRA